MQYSLEYLSLNYLDMWLRHDRVYHESLNHGTRKEKLISLKKASAYYKVARNLPKKYDEEIGRERYEPIARILEKANATDFSVDPIKSISKVQKKISKAYGDTGVLSITTKLLWLKIRDPIIIYDSQARKALGTMDGDLHGFYQAWRTEFKTHRKEIENVCSKLDRVAKYTCNQTIATPEYIRSISAQRWFQERVFDVFLWHQGQ